MTRKLHVIVAYLLDEWMSTHRVEPKTRQSYELLITKFIKLDARRKLQRLGPQSLERFYADLLRCRSAATAGRMLCFGST